jgi:tetratricopeptide (TPR) repeat protein
MKDAVTRLLVAYSYWAVDRLRRVSPPSLRRLFRRLLGSQAIFAFEFLAKGSVLASMREHEKAIEAAGPGLADEYNRLLAGNAADLLAEVMKRFYSDLGVDAHSVPLVQGLDRFRQQLSDRESDRPETEPASILIRFERTWNDYRNGRTDVALRSFETIFRDTVARKRAGRDPFVKEAVVRSGEILGRRQDTLGNVEQAIAIYREIIAVDPDGVIAHRLTSLLARRGDLQQAAKLAETVVFSRPNLFPYLPSNPYIASLKAEIARK